MQRCGLIFSINLIRFDLVHNFVKIIVYYHKQSETDFRHFVGIFDALQKRRAYNAMLRFQENGAKFSPIH